jgi:bis(5'-nucleosyl)-tetraphosphatase (symmetrical)
MTLMNVDTLERLQCKCDEQGHTQPPVASPIPEQTSASAQR